MTFMLFFINFTGTSLSWQAFLLSTFCISLAILFLVTYLKEKLNPLARIFLLIFNMLGWLAYFSIALKTGSALFVWLVISLKLLSMLRFFTMVLKKLLNVSAIFLLSVMVLPCSFSIIDSLRKVFSENRTHCFPKFSIINFQFCCLAAHSNLFSFRAASSRKCFFAYYKDF